jgi:hypothetical protein
MAVAWPIPELDPVTTAIAISSPLGDSKVVNDGLYTIEGTTVFYPAHESSEAFPAISEDTVRLQQIHLLHIEATGPSIETFTVVSDAIISY